MKNQSFKELKKKLGKKLLISILFVLLLFALPFILLSFDSEKINDVLLNLIVVNLYGVAILLFVLMSVILFVYRYIVSYWSWLTSSNHKYKIPSDLKDDVLIEKDFQLWEILLIIPVLIFILDVVSIKISKDKVTVKRGYQKWLGLEGKTINLSESNELVYRRRDEWRFGYITMISKYRLMIIGIRVDNKWYKISSVYFSGREDESFVLNKLNKNLELL